MSTCPKANTNYGRLPIGQLFCAMAGNDQDAVCPITGKLYRDKRSKQEWGYSYDEFMQWQARGFEFAGYGAHKEITGAYSDRLFQFDSDKYDSCCLTVFSNKGQYWGNRAPRKIEAFLQLYFGCPELKLKYVIEGCNPSSGYPYWVFGYTKS